MLAKSKRSFSYVVKAPVVPKLSLSASVLEGSGDKRKTVAKRSRSSKGKRKGKRKGEGKGGVGEGKWLVRFEDGFEVVTPYYPNPRMAVGYAVNQHVGKVADVKYMR